jgi:hypothetical protein
MCTKTIDCACPKTECPRHGDCSACVKNHRESDSLPFCMFMDNDGDKSLKSYYLKLKERFEKETPPSN